MQKKWFFFGLGMTSLLLTSLAYSRPYQYKVRDSKVNTRIERKYDLNHDGWISRRERRILKASGVNTRFEYRCDHNHNGVIDPAEVRCAY